MVFNVRGTVTGYSYEDLPGVVVTVRNVTNGEEGTATAGAAGAYTFDLDTLASGQSVGDEIRIRATHRDVTRTWFARVDGSEIVQDVYFTHGTYRGALRTAALLVEDVVTGETGTTVELRDAHTKDVLQIVKNGSLLAEADWSFTKPRTITLTAALVASDVLEVERAVHRSIRQAKDSVVSDGDSLVRNAMARYYPSPLPSRVPELQDLSEQLSASKMRHILFSGAEDVDDLAENLWKASQSMLSELRKGERSLTDQDGAFITPTAKTVGVARSSITPTRRQKRFTEDNELIDL